MQTHVIMKKMNDENGKIKDEKQQVLHIRLLKEVKQKAVIERRKEGPLCL